MPKRNKKTIIVGLTGGIGTGKSTIASQFKQIKIPVFDSDKEVDKLYKEKNKGLMNIIKNITNSKEVIKKGQINKKLLGDIVFNNRKKLLLLESYVYKKLDVQRKLFIQKYKKQNKKIIVLDTPLLFEKKIDKICDYTVVAKAPLKKRIKRLLKRPGLTKKKIIRIRKKQLPEKIKIKRADFVVQTDKGKWYSLNKVRKIKKTILKKTT